MLILALGRPERFGYVWRRANWDAWLVKGAYLLGGFGGVLACSGAVLLFGLDRIYLEYLAYAGVPLALLTGVYTAWLLKQARGRSWSEDGLLEAKMIFEMVVVGVGGVFLMASPGILSILVFAILMAVVASHAHGTVIKPQLETLH